MWGSLMHTEQNAESICEKKKLEARVKIKKAINIFRSK